MGCNSLHTDLVTEKFYGVSQIMGYQSYGLRELRLYNTRVHSLNSCKRNITLNHGHSKDQRGKLATRRCQKLTKIADARFI
jgi:hypothetical protein